MQPAAACEMVHVIPDRTSPDARNTLKHRLASAAPAAYVSISRI
jgi:hypothetical protein